ncbi:hypothetical protein QUF74_04525 [Candidatus Halobeggiatoa sp. HSG11]|nr:hypothetical protein [Candidatus Halobeggiatoa sp. HSG11]
MNKLKTLNTLHQSIADLNKQLLAGEWYLSQAKTPEEKAKHENIMTDKEKQVKTLISQLKTACANDPITTKAWVVMHQEILQEITESIKVAVPPPESHKVMLHVAEQQMADWDKVLIGEQIYVSINDHWFKDYSQRLAEKL